MEKYNSDGGTQERVHALREAAGQSRDTVPTGTLRETSEHASEPSYPSVGRLGICPGSAPPPPPPWALSPHCTCVQPVLLRKPRQRCWEGPVLEIGSRLHRQADSCSGEPAPRWAEGTRGRTFHRLGSRKQKVF